MNKYRIEADTLMDAGVRGIAEFALRLKDLYETLSGKARLEEPYYVHNDIAFVAETGGHVKVAGRLSKKNAFGFTHDISACRGNPL